MRHFPTIKQEATAAGVDPLLVAAMVAVESSGDAKARSPKDAQGLMQLIPATAQRFGVTNTNDPTQNIRGGAKYLAWLIDRFDGNYEHALAGYNAGEGRVDQYGGIPPFKETREYVPKVLATYNLLRNQYGGPQAAQQAPGGPAVSPGLAPANMRPAEPTPQDRGIGALGTDFGQAWAARTAGRDGKVTKAQELQFKAWQDGRKAIEKDEMMEAPVRQAQLKRHDDLWRPLVGGLMPGGGAPGLARQTAADDAAAGRAGQGVAGVAGEVDRDQQNLGRHAAR
jgi:hypothetical protein